MKLFYAIAIVLMVFVSACVQQTVEGPQTTSPESGPSTEPEMEVETPAEVPEEVVEVTTNEVRYVGAGAFEPDELTISAGSLVTWINGDEKKGAVLIFKDGRSYMNSPGLIPEDKFEVEFTEAGEYEFWWNIAYSGDGGKITVE